MSWIKPDWYLTPQEFADLVIESLEVTNHFKRDESAHPEDIVIAFVTQAEAIAIGAGAAGRKVHAAKKDKKAVMQNKDLQKSMKKYALPLDEEIAPDVDALGYSEAKHQGYL